MRSDYSIDFYFSDKIVTLQNASVELNKTIKILIHTKTCVANALCWLCSFSSQISNYFFSLQWTKNLQFLLLVAPIGYFLSICSQHCLTYDIFSVQGGMWEPLCHRLHISYHCLHHKHSNVVFSLTNFWHGRICKY